MNRTRKYVPHSVKREDRQDGSILLGSRYSLSPVVSKTGEWLHRWASETPDNVFLAERSGGGWRTESYLSTLEKVRALSASLLGRGLNQNTPIAVLSSNSINHGLLALAAQNIGVPIVPLAEQYSLIPEAHGRLVEALKLLKPRMAFVEDADRFSSALSLGVLENVEIVSTYPGQSSITSFDELLKGNSITEVDVAYAEVGPDTVAKILMTSGSTSSPKGVLTTHRMMCINQAQLADSMPFLREKAPRIVDWLPWNHVFGGSHNFNMMLANGGSLYIDDGKPLKGLFDRTVENLSLMTGSLAFNVPIGFSMLHDILKTDASLRQRFFEDLDLIFYAGASLPQDLWEGIEKMAMEVKGEIPLMTSSWGLTETAPALMLQQEPTERSGVVGVPLNGVTLKLIPESDNRFEVRAKADNVMPGYFDNPVKTKEAFDEEGFFITGDAMSFVDPDDVNKGMRFEGRISDDFKLLTGTWVRATALRAELLTCLAPFATDLVITGHDRSEIGVLIFPDRAALQEAGFSDEDSKGALINTTLKKEISERLATHAGQGSGSSMRVGRALILEEPPSMPEGEMTAKGNLNSRKILTRRADLLERLYDDNDHAVCKP